VERSIGLLKSRSLVVPLETGRERRAIAEHFIRTVPRSSGHGKIGLGLSLLGGVRARAQGGPYLQEKLAQFCLAGSVCLRQGVVVVFKSAFPDLPRSVNLNDTIVYHSSDRSRGMQPDRLTKPASALNTCTPLGTAGRSLVEPESAC
jgi:hypothetical protein